MEITFSTVISLHFFSEYNECTQSYVAVKNKFFYLLSFVRKRKMKDDKRSQRPSNEWNLFTYAIWKEK